MDPIKVSFTPTAAEMHEAMRLHSRRTRLFVLVGTAVVVVIAIALRAQDEYVDWLSLLVRIALVLGAAVALAMLWSRRQAARLAAELREIEIEFADDAIRSRTPVASAERRWDAFRGFLEGRGVLLLYAAAGFVFVPKRALPDGGSLERLRGMIRAHLPASR